MGDDDAAERVTLRDGAEVLLRPIRPEDKAMLATGFDRLSEESRYRRFLSPMQRLSPSLLTYLTEVDHHDHEALLAIDAATGAGVGVGRFVRLEDPEVAEAAVTVVDDWQGRGVGTLLLEHIATRARDEGVVRLNALVLAENDAMLDLLRGLGETRMVAQENGTVEVEAELPDEASREPWQRLLSMAARRLAGITQRTLPDLKDD